MNYNTEFGKVESNRQCSHSPFNVACKLNIMRHLANNQKKEKKTQRERTARDEGNKGEEKIECYIAEVNRIHFAC